MKTKNKKKEHTHARSKKTQNNKKAIVFGCSGRTRPHPAAFTSEAAKEEKLNFRIGQI